jgi:hypothetical protein
MQTLVKYLIIGSLFSATERSLIAQTSIVVHPAWSYNKTIYEVNLRQYTEDGTF